MLKNIISLFKRKKDNIVVNDICTLLSILRPGFSYLCKEFERVNLPIEAKVRGALKKYDEGVLRPEYYEGDFGKHMRRYFKLWAEIYFLSRHYNSKLYKIEQKLEKFMPFEFKDKK